MLGKGGSADVPGRNAVASHDVTLDMSAKEESSRSKRIKICVFLSTELNSGYPVGVVHSASMRTISETWDFFLTQGRGCVHTHRYRNKVSSSLGAPVSHTMWVLRYGPDRAGSILNH